MKVVRLLVYEGDADTLDGVLGRSAADGLTPYGAYNDANAYSIRAITLRGGFLRRTRAVLNALFHRTTDAERQVAEVTTRLYRGSVAYALKGKG